MQKQPVHNFFPFWKIGYQKCYRTAAGEFCGNYPKSHRGQHCYKIEPQKMFYAACQCPLTRTIVKISGNGKEQRHRTIGKDKHPSLCLSREGDMQKYHKNSCYHLEAFHSLISDPGICRGDPFGHHIGSLLFAFFNSLAYFRRKRNCGRQFTAPPTAPIP